MNKQMKDKKKVSRRPRFYIVEILTFVLLMFVGRSIGDIAHHTEKYMGIIDRLATSVETHVDEKVADLQAVDMPFIKKGMEELSNTGFATPAYAQTQSNVEYKVQAVLSPKHHAVISSAIEGKIIKFNVNSGGSFSSGDVLIEYDCTVDYGRLKEATSRQKSSQLQLDAFKELKDLKSVSQIEYDLAKEANEQAKALVQQVRGRVAYCKVLAPFDGRVSNKMASLYEYVQPGRALMDIASKDPLRAQFLIPSRWLRWLNIGTPLSIHLKEVNRDYDAKIIEVYGEVDPVSETIEVVAELEKYHEELLPGMSGFAVFNPNLVKAGSQKGYLGLILGSDGGGGNGPRSP